MLSYICVYVDLDGIIIRLLCFMFHMKLTKYRVHPCVITSILSLKLHVGVFIEPLV